MKEKLFKIVTMLVVLILLARPDTIILALFLDSVGIELFILLLGMQFKTFWLFVYLRLLPIQNFVKQSISRFDEFFFVPMLRDVKEFPGLALHAIPGLGLAFKSIWCLRTNPHV